MNFIKSHWKLILAVIAAIVLLTYIGSVTGANRKLVNMMLDQIRVDQSNVIKTQAENMKWYEETIATLQTRLDSINAKLKATDAKLDTANRAIDTKDAEIATLRRERETVTTSSNADDIVVDLHKLGYRTERVRSR